MSDALPLLKFREHYVERIWGGRRLERHFGKPLPPDTRVGEAWLISDHYSHESIVAEGPLQGRSLRELVQQHADALLGTGAKLTPHGRFPLLLKLLDADEDLSVQVHPDDATAARLGEPDVGKTEMWHVLYTEPGSRLITGIHEHTDPDTFVRSASSPDVEALLNETPVQPGDSIFVPAGTVHAIGKGIVLAEIQQNSDLTYRLYDYGRLQADGTPRQLHLDKAREAIRWDAPPVPIAEAVRLPESSGERHLLAACPYFAAELVHVDGSLTCDTRGHSFHILLPKSGPVTVRNGNSEVRLAAGEAVLVPGASRPFELAGSGTILDYFVPDWTLDIVHPLQALGWNSAMIARRFPHELGGV